VVVVSGACGTDVTPDAEAECRSASLAAEAGVLEIGESRIFYSFHPADDCQASRPLAVLFNGGPGVSTAPLMTLNTGPFALASYRGGEVAPNPHSWTRFANLLYVDARLTGFSYDLAPFAGTYTWHADTALFVRVLLRFLAEHLELRANRVALVGESYGGTRATRMLDVLLHYGERAGAELESEIQAHYDAVFDAAGQHVPPDVIAQQFGHQVLIQPFVLPDQGPSCGAGEDDTSHSAEWLGDLFRSIRRRTDVDRPHAVGRRPSLDPVAAPARAHDRDAQPRDATAPRQLGRDARRAERQRRLLRVPGGVLRDRSARAR
jgi:hypothetical protein